MAEFKGLSEDELKKLCKPVDPETKDFLFQQTMYRIKDPQVSLPFYTGVLGMTLLQKMDFPESKFSLYFLGYESAADVPTTSNSDRTIWAMTRKVNTFLVGRFGIVYHDLFVVIRLTCRLPWNWRITGALRQRPLRFITLATRSRAVLATLAFWCPMCMPLVSASKNWAWNSSRNQTRVAWRDWHSFVIQMAIGLRFSIRKIWFDVAGLNGNVLEQYAYHAIIQNRFLATRTNLLPKYFVWKLKWNDELLSGINCCFDAWDYYKYIFLKLFYRRKCIGFTYSQISIQISILQIQSRPIDRVQASKFSIPFHIDFVDKMRACVLRIGTTPYNGMWCMSISTHTHNTHTQTHRNYKHLFSW